MPTNLIQYRLSINTSGYLGDFCHLIIFNGFNEIVKKGYGSLSIELPRGIYRIRLELNEEVKEEMVRLDQDVELNMETPKSHSSIVAEDFSSSHEYYTKEAIRWSKEPTTQNDKKGLWSALFIFMRYPNADICSQFKQKSLGNDFSILDEHRKKIFELKGPEIREDKESGWMAFHAPVQNGQYYIHYAGKKKREIPVYAFNGWQSQLFLTFREDPIFPSLKISTERITTGFRTDNPVNYIMDASLQKLHNGIYFIPEKIMDRLAQGSWDNPMMGLLTAYIYFNSGKRNKDELFRKLLDNYDRIILADQQAPDLVALKLLASKYFNEPLPSLKLSAPCMFMTGMKVVMELFQQHVDVLDENSFIELAIKKLYGDMEWTSYDPPPIGIKPTKMMKI